MMNKTFTKLMKGCALAMALAMTTVSISAYAAEPTPTEVNKIEPGGEGKTEEETKRAGLNPTDTTTYTDTSIDVWGYTKDTVVYSVDVEWGAMTFEYEAFTWNPETHQKDTTNAGWKIYDESAGDAGEALAVAQAAINRVTVTNHSNAPVYAQMSYAGTGEKAVADGEFAAIDADASTDAGTADVKATWNDTNKYLTLLTASTTADGTEVSGDTEGVPSKGNVYFMPTSEVAAGTTIDKWTTIGKINVAVTTAVPTTSTP